MEVGAQFTPATMLGSESERVHGESDSDETTVRAESSDEVNK